MPDVELVATKDFSYATRRLKAGDHFTVKAPMARVLVGIGKAEEPRKAGKVAPPPRELLDRGAAAVKANAAVRTGTTSAKAPRKRRTTRKSAAKKG